MASRLRGRSSYIVSLVLLAAGNLALSALERGRDVSAASLDLAAFPLAFAGWEGSDHYVSERERRMLGTPNLIYRRYRKNRAEVNLYILESATNRASFHPPEYCYVGGRTEMIERERVELEGPDYPVPARRFVFVGPRGRHLVYYWYTFGDSVTDSYYRQQIQVVSRIFFGRRIPAMLLRVSVEGRFDLEWGDEIIRDFISDALPLLDRHLLRSAVAEERGE